MSDAVTISIIGAIVALTTVILNKRLGEVHKKVNEIETRIDGRMDELLELTRKSSQAQGNKEGREEQAEENKKDPA